MTCPVLTSGWGILLCDVLCEILQPEQMTIDDRFKVDGIDGRILSTVSECLQTEPSDGEIGEEESD